MPRSGNYQNELPLFNVLLVSVSPAWRDQIASQSLQILQIFILGNCQALLVL